MRYAPPMSARPRIAFFTDTFLPKRDGIVTVLCLLLDHLQARGIATAVVAPQLRSCANRYGKACTSTHVIRVRGLPFPPYPELTLGPPTPATFRQLRAFAPDLVHLIHPAWLGGFGLAWAKRHRLPTLASFHLDLAQLSRRYRLGLFAPAIAAYTHRVFRAADFALAPSVAILGQLRAAGISRSGIWRRGVDAQRFHPRFASPAMRARLSDGHPDAPLLLYVGRLSAEKQLHLIRPALEQIPSARLALVGDGPRPHRAGESVRRHRHAFRWHPQRRTAQPGLRQRRRLRLPLRAGNFRSRRNGSDGRGHPGRGRARGWRAGSDPRWRENGYSFAPGDVAGMVAGALKEMLASLASGWRRSAKPHGPTP